MRSRLLRALEQLGFERDELVYLALSSKVERQVVDRLAWRLHRTEELRTTREWKRTDLAIFRPAQAKPVALLEAKAFSSFAAVRQPEKYPAQIHRDIEKVRHLAERWSIDPEVFVLAVVTHVEDAAAANLKDLVKYPFWFREPVPLEEANALVRRFLMSRGPVEHVTLQRGQAWDVPARVEAWLCGPIA